MLSSYLCTSTDYYHFVLIHSQCVLTHIHCSIEIVLKLKYSSSMASSWYQKIKGSLWTWAFYPSPCSCHVRDAPASASLDGQACSLPHPLSHSKAGAVTGVNGKGSFCALAQLLEVIPAVIGQFTCLKSLLRFWTRMLMRCYNNIVTQSARKSAS